RAASHNATTVGHALEASPHVIAVNYPGLDSHPHRHIAKKQHRDGMGGGMLSFRIQGGHAAAERFCQLTKIFTLAESLSRDESLIELPGRMSQPVNPRDQSEAVGVFDYLVRLSCGVEEAEYLKNDVLQAHEKAVKGPPSNGVANGDNGQ